MNNKYDNTFYKEIKYSVSIILNYIIPRTTILEFGPGNGELTKFLKEEYGCKIYTIEIDKELHDISKQYAVDSICCDADGLEWSKKFKNIEFDYIIFADVLEHLRNPQYVLLHAVQLLKPNGNILFSIPNIAHNDIILNLINNKFVYTEEGLLDKTHIHFFTYNSIVEMFQRIGLKHIEIDKIIKQTGFTEINIDIDLIPQEILDIVKDKEYGDVYQFVGKASVAEDVSVKQIGGRQIIESYNAVFYLEEKHPINAEIVYDEYTKQLSSEIIIHKHESLDFDIILFPSMVSIMIDDVKFNAGEINIIPLNAGKINGRDIFFNEARYRIKLTVTKNVDNLNIIIKWNKSNISYDEMKSIAWVTKEYLINEVNKVKEICTIEINNLKNIYNEKEKDINKLNYTIQEKDQQIISRDSEINKLNNALREKDTEIISRDSEINKLNNALREKDAEIISRDSEINKLNNSLRETDSGIISRDEEINKLNYAFRELEAGIIARDEQVKQLLYQANENLKLFNKYKDNINKLERENVHLKNELNRIKKSFFYKFIR